MVRSPVRLPARSAARPPTLQCLAGSKLKQLHIVGALSSPQTRAGDQLTAGVHAHSRARRALPLGSGTPGQLSLVRLGGQARAKAQTNRRIAEEAWPASEASERAKERQTDRQTDGQTERGTEREGEKSGRFLCHRHYDGLPAARRTITCACSNKTSPLSGSAESILQHS